MSLAPSLLLAASGLVYWAINSRSSTRKKVVKDKTTQTTPTVVLNDTQALINKLVEYKKQNPAFTYVIGVDVGATNFRTAFIFTNSNNVNSTFEIKLQCRNMNFFRNFYAELGEQIVKSIGVKPLSSVLALAGPIKGDCVEITNYDEGARELFVSELTDLLFPRGKTKFINDLEAACYGIISLGVEKKLNDFMASLWLPNEKSNLSVDLADVSCKIILCMLTLLDAVLSMGTGLGVGIIQFSPSFEGRIKYKPLALEAGHCLIPFPASGSAFYDRDVARLRYLSKKLYNSKYGVEYEDICSGRGLQYCYEFELTQLPNYKEGDILDILSPGESMLLFDLLTK
jgi:glucokinase